MNEPAPREKVTKAELEHRVSLIYEMLLNGQRRREVLRAANEQHGWGVSPRQVDSYIAKARKLFERDAQVHREAELGKAIARLDSLYAKTQAKQDLRTALMVERELIELLDLRVRQTDDQSAVDEFLAVMKGEAEDGP